MKSPATNRPKKAAPADRRVDIVTGLARLRAGNVRFATGLLSAETLTSRERLKKLATEGQRPFASVLACADSRVPSEMVFDQGLGDLFVCRVAGSVASPLMIASIEYAATALETPLTLVLGHTRCGAVAAAVGAVTGSGGAPASRHIRELAAKIAPAVRESEREAPECAEEELVRRTWETNARLQAREVLARSPLLRKLRREGRWDIVHAVYDIESGLVNFAAGAPR